MRLAVPSWPRPWAWPCDVAGGKRRRSDLIATDCSRTEHAVCRRRRRLVDGADLLWWVPGVTRDRRWISSDARRKTCHRTDERTARADGDGVLMASDRHSRVADQRTRRAVSISCEPSPGCCCWCCPCPPDNTTQHRLRYIAFTRIISTNPALPAMRRS